MVQSDLYTAIFQRKSVRKYAAAPLDAPTLEEIEAFIAEIPALTPGASCALRLLAPTQVTRAMTAPHYAVAYSGTDKLSLLAAGYQLQYLSLYLTSRRLGSCYNGMAAPHKSCTVWQGMPSAMVLLLGTPDEPFCRSGLGEFKRKPTNQICTDSVPKTIAEAVRVAPSGVNRQPWLLRGDKQAIQVLHTPKGLMSKLMPDMANIDMGIALCHLRLAAEQQGMNCRFDFDAAPVEPLGRKEQMICRVTL